MKRNSYPGKFIVIEGIDGAGGETQSKKLTEYFKDSQLLEYPDYTGPIGKLIDAYLHKQYEFSKEVQLLLYFADFLKDKEKITKWLQEGKTIIADRYFTTTIAYQCFKGVSLDTALATSKLFDLPIPNLVFYLDITAETSMKRKQNEKGELDRNEENREFLQSLTNSYKELVKEQILTKWVIIDGEQPLEKVTRDIQHEIRSYNWA